MLRLVFLLVLVVVVVVVLLLVLVLVFGVSIAVGVVCLPPLFNLPENQTKKRLIWAGTQLAWAGAGFRWQPDRRMKKEASGGGFTASGWTSSPGPWPLDHAAHSCPLSSPLGSILPLL